MDIIFTETCTNSDTGEETTVSALVDAMLEEEPTPLNSRTQLEDLFLEDKLMGMETANFAFVTRELFDTFQIASLVYDDKFVYKFLSEFNVYILARCHERDS